MEGEPKVKVLILDPARSVRNALKERLAYEGFEVDAFETLDEGYEAAAKNGGYQLLLIDGDLSDLHIASGNHGAFGNVSPIIISSNPSTETAVHSIRNGAWDFVSKPVDMNRLLRAINGVMEQRAEEDKLPRKKPTAPVMEDSDEEDESGIVGASGAIARVKSLIDRVGPSSARVMIMGPNGVGKELVARWLHRKSKRTGLFVEVNCAAIPSELIESELFGHEKGAFTSAIKQRKGKFEQAEGGTLFLDEVGDMSLSAQAKVLRALQEKKVSRVGGEKDIDVDVRVVAATNKNIPEEIAAGRFREDLYHRLSVIVINVPPLIERLDDIPILTDYFLKKICREYGIACKEIDPEGVVQLQRRDWSGNIRELRNVVERLIILSDDRITIEDVLAHAGG